MFNSNKMYLYLYTLLCYRIEEREFSFRQAFLSVREHLTPASPGLTHREACIIIVICKRGGGKGLDICSFVECYLIIS